MTTQNKPFKPDWISHPKESIVEGMEERGLTQVEFAARMGISKKHANDLVAGRAGITSETAAGLAAVLGSTPGFWINLQSNYEAERLRFAREARLEAEHAGWLGELPIRDMVGWGWMHDFVTKGARIEEALRFFGVATVEAWRSQYVERFVAFRTSAKHPDKPGATAAWIRRGEVEAAALACDPWDGAAFKALIPSLRGATRVADPKEALRAVQQACAKVGVAVVLVRAPRGCRASGATFFLTSERAVLLLSARFLTDDHLWFTFFHEAGHLVLHGKKRLFIETDGLDSEEEHQANHYAANLLIPPSAAPRLSGLRTAAAVEAFAEELGVSSGVVVGRLQHEGVVPFSALNSLKVRYAWTTEQDDG